MAIKRKLTAMTPKVEEPMDSSDELMFLYLGEGNKVGRSYHIIQYKGKTVMLDAGQHPAYDGLASSAFGFAFDKLVAISGLASAIQGYTKNEYLAGLWRRDIIPQLAWFTLGGWSENFLDTLGTESYNAPSWSWASVSRPVGISAPQDTKGEWGYREVSTLIDYGVDLKGSTITGAVCGGFLRVQGPLRRVSIISRDGETDDNSDVIDDDVKNAGDNIQVIGNISQEVRNDLEDADNDSEDKDHGSGDVGEGSGGIGDDWADKAVSSWDVGEGSGGIGDDWADKAVSSWDTSDDSEVPGNGWDDTGNDNTCQEK
ncbi:hypothetical protein JMJ35_005540 [Cladonia borealis]|uniref:Uncharacterized protein n=1 Tax=Cladonia borealis TaxID=184061 RepID=A0AA39V1R5_9LECA|nr:hypothetical protein JMJ35_005540 [Cladonia borealis]